MSRSVDNLSNAEIVVYKSAHNLRDDFDWDLFENDIIETLEAIAPTLETCKRWDENETRIILENGLIEVGLSEYNGLVSLSFRAKEEGDNYEDISGLSSSWLEQLRSRFEQLGDLIKIGTFSNGEAMFKSGDNKTFSSKEGFCEWAN